METKENNETKFAVPNSMIIKWIENEHGTEIPIYNSNENNVYILRNTMGILGICTARDIQQALEITEDEFYQEAEETLERIIEEYGENYFDNPLFQEKYGFRPSGANIKDKIGHGIYQKDLNGESLELLTIETIEKLDLRICLISY